MHQPKNAELAQYRTLEDFDLNFFCSQIPQCNQAGADLLQKFAFNLRHHRSLNALKSVISSTVM